MRNREFTDEEDLSESSLGLDNDRLMGLVMDVMTRLSREEIEIDDAREEVREIFSCEI